MDNLEPKVAQIVIRNSEVDYRLVSMMEFLKISALDRYNLLIEKKVEFIDFDGEKVPLLEGLRYITTYMKELRDKGTLANSILSDDE